MLIGIGEMKVDGMVSTHQGSTCCRERKKLAEFFFFFFFLDWSDLRTIAAILVGQKLAQLSGSNMQAKQDGKKLKLKLKLILLRMKLDGYIV